MANKNICPACGKEVQHDNIHCPHCGESLIHHHNNRWKWATLAILCLAAIAGTAYYYIFKPDKAAMFDEYEMTEQDAWDVICYYRDTNNPDSLDGALAVYDRDYPKGPHSFDVKTLKERLNKEIKMWNKIEENGSKREMVETYMFEYAEEGFFFLSAVDKLDSITFFEKQAINTPEAYQEYLDRYPEGKYVKKAQDNISNLDIIPLNQAEEQKVVDVINEHFKAMEQNDTVLVANTIAKTLSSYMGKAGCKKSDVNEYIKHIFKVNGRKVGFETKDFAIKKITAPDDEDKVIFNVEFRLHETMNKPAANAIDTKMEKDFDATAVLNNDYLITSIMLTENKLQ